MNDRERVLWRLHSTGRTTPVEWIGSVCDHGKPIMRLAARVKELRDEGHEITTERIPNGTALYLLKASPEAAVTPPASPHPPVAQAASGGEPSEDREGATPGNDRKETVSGPGGRASEEPSEQLRLVA